jgi:hypothetical protein
MKCTTHAATGLATMQLVVQYQKFVVKNFMQYLTICSPGVKQYKAVKPPMHLG